MRIKAILAGAAFGLTLALSSVAQAQCLLCGVIGYELGVAGSSEQPAGASPNTVYVMPNIAGRLPPGHRLEVMFAASYVYKNISIREIFKATVPEADLYEILEVMRLIKSDDPGRAIFWFAYIERKYLEPVSGN